MESKRRFESEVKFAHHSMQVSNIHFTNFPVGWNAESLWNIFKNYGEILDVYIPAKKNIRGQKYGFVSFTNMMDVAGLIDSLNQIWIGSYKLRFSLAKSSFVQNVSHNSCSLEQPSATDMPIDSSRKRTYADVVKRVGETLDNSSGSFESKPVGVSVDKDKVASFVNLVAGSIPIDQVQLSLEDNLLSIKIYLSDKLKGTMMEAENQDIRLQSSEKLNSCSDNTRWGVEFLPSSDNSWGSVNFSSMLSEEEIGGGFRLLEAQCMGNMGEVNALIGGPFKGHVETSSLVGSVESSSKDWALQIVKEVNMESDKGAGGEVEGYDLSGLTYFEPIVDICNQNIFQVANYSFEEADVTFWEEEAIPFGPVIEEAYCSKVTRKDKFQGRVIKAPKSSLCKIKKKATRRKIRKSKKEALDMFRVEDVVADGISDYSISDEDIQHRNEERLLRKRKIRMVAKEQ
ncbi:hypothetical protein PTKIN_Ptkin16aG0016200 [Pterospermum kingtungense]